MTDQRSLGLFLPVKNVETAVIGAAQDLRVVVAEGEAEDAEPEESWRRQGELQVGQVVVSVRGEADQVEVVTPGGVDQPVSSMTDSHVQHRPTNISSLTNTSQ